MNCKVYVVDDEPRVRESVADLMQSIGMETESFESTEDFLHSFVATDSRQCVIADLRMPGLSGLDLKRALVVRDCAAIPVILLTGYRDDETDARATALGIFEILEKPYPPKELLEVTRRALQIST